MEEEILKILKIAGPPGIAGALLLIPKIRALLWELLVMIAIAVAKKHYDERLEELRRECQAKMDVLIAALGRSPEEQKDITDRMKAVRPSQPPRKPSR